MPTTQGSAALPAAPLPSPSSSPNDGPAPSPRARPPPLAPLQPPRLSFSGAQDPPPQSPAVVLSPSTPDFPIGTLALGPPPPQPEVQELVPARELPRAVTPPLPPALEAEDDDDEELEELCEEEPASEDVEGARRVRHSLMLLDSRLAEIESLGFGSPVLEEDEEEVRSPFRFLRRAQLTKEQQAARAHTLPADLSMNSLASFATTTTTSSEDAFDIADFPSIDPLDSGYELDPSTLPQPRRRSSDIMAFPAPPGLASLPGSARPSISVAPGADELRMFEQLAQLGQRASVQGLGLFSGEEEELVSTSRGDEGGRDSRSSSLSGSDSSTLSDKSFDASTLASSAANMSFGPRDKEFPPPELPAQTSWFAMSPPTTAPRVLPPPIDPLLANTAAAAHALASPFGRSAGGGTSPSMLARRSSPTATQYSVRSSSLPSRRSSSRAAAAPAESDEGGAWALSPPTPITAETFVLSPEAQSQELEILVDEPPPVPHKEDDDRSPKVPSSPASSFGKTLRRLSSFGLLKARKSTGVLRESTGSNNAVVVEPQQQRTPLLSKRKSEAALSKRKSEAALSALLLRSSRNTDKENSPAPLSPRQTSARPLVSPHQPAKLALRSVSSPKLADKASAARENEPRPPLPISPASYAGASPVAPSGFAARPRTLSFGEGEQTTGKLKKRLSMYFNQLGGKAQDDSIPPVPPTPTEHLPAKARAPAPIVIDVAKANELLREVSEPSSAGTTLEIASPAPASSLFSEDIPGTSSPATSALPPRSASSMSAFSRPSVALSAKDKPLPVPLPTSSLSAPSHQTGFVFPPSPRAEPDPRLSLYGFIRTADESALPASADAGKPSVFPSTKLAQERQSARRRASESRSSSRATSVEQHQGGWTSRPVSPFTALQDGTFAPQEIIAFPVRVQPELGRTLPAQEPLSRSPTSINDDAGGSDDSGEDDSGEDDYGSNTDDSDEDKPLGVVVPGALTAQKSLRLTAAKKTRSERKAREAEEKARRSGGKGMQPPRGRREDPFELEHTAAMVSTPPASNDGHTAPPQPYTGAGLPSIPRHVRPPLSPIASASTVATVQSIRSAGHDALLPQDDASLERRAASNGMKRSPSAPLDPMVADSSLTIDSPELPRKPLPARARAPFSLPSAKRDSRPRSSSRPRKSDGLHVATSASLASPVEPPLRSPPLVAALPKPTFRPPPVPSASSSSSAQPAAAAAPPFDRRPSLAGRSSESPTSSPSGTPHLSRRPSLHPDLHPPSMKRQASSSSAKSGSTLSRAGTLSAGGRSRSTTVSSAALPAVEQRVYVDAAFAQFVKVNVTDKTLAGEVVAFAKGKGALAKETPGAAEGGWALWEAWRTTGIERPIREYEFVADVTKSWDQEGNALFFRRTTMWPILSAHARPHPPGPKSGAVQLEIKKGKWSKRFLTLKDGTLSYSKSEKGKDSTTLCQLSNFDVFLVSPEQANRLKAPRTFVFALKSRLTRAHFEETSEWCHYLATKTPEEAASWVKSITEAGNPFARIREQAVLGAVSPTSPTSPPMPATSLLASAGFTATDAPPVPAVPVGAGLTRNPTSRPMPPALAQRSYTAPLPPAGAPQQSLARHKSVVKPDSRQWGAMGESQRQEWLATSERVAKQTKTPLVDLSR
ncbi:hypothetical protein JCM10449v2_000753 [Rhodotorula kratochvilovae]